MKILLTMNLPYMRAHGGTNRSNRSLAEGLAGLGHAVRVVVPALPVPSRATHEEAVAELRAEGVDVRTLGGVDFYEVNGVEVRAVVEPSRLRSYLVEEIGRFAPDWTLVSAEDQSQNLLDAALRECPSRVVYLAHTPQMFPFGPASLYPGEARTQLVGRAAAIVTISEFVAGYIKRWTGFEAFVNHPPHFGSGPFPQLGRYGEGHVLLMNACAVKGISIFLELADSFPGVPFAALPGYGTTAADRAALAARPNVTLLKNERHLDDIFRQTRLLLMPSLWVEGFGMAVVDAMLRGIPVLASNFGGLLEAKLGTDYLLPVRPIEEFEERLEENMLPAPIVPPQDIAPWRDALGELLSARALYEKQSAEAREASLRFISGLSVAPFEDLLRRLSAQPAAAHTPAAEASATARQAPSKSEPDPLEDLSDLSPEQQELLQLWLQQELAERDDPESKPLSIRPAPRDGNIPLSFTQQRLWFLEQLEPGTPLYNIPAAVRLVGPLDVAALGRALSEVVRRHESLRTTFAEVDGQPVQVVAEAGDFALTVEDLSGLSDDGREAEAARLLYEEARRPFDLRRGPLLRARLLRLSEQQHVVALVMHHIISDGWSMGVFVGEVGTLYGAFTRGEESPLAELPIQYADYAVWQREHLTGAALDEQLSYWRERLSGVPVLELPTERPRPAARTHAGTTHSFMVPDAVGQRLKELSLREDVTLFMTMLAAFNVLLHRYSGQEDIAVGTPIAGRQLPELEGLIGFFINTLVLRTDLSGDPSFRELLGRVREVTLGAYTHQDVPFERLVEELQPERSARHQPLFQVAFALQNASRGTLELPGLSARTETPQTGLSKFDLTLGVQETEGGLGVTLEYSTDLFDLAAVERMAGHFTTLLAGIAARPEEHISSLPMLGDAERRRLLVEFNDTRTAYPSDLCVHQLFERQAERTPDAAALVFGPETLTYAELNARANQLARRLRGEGVGPESRVGVCAERSAELVVALLAVLKAGGAYVPLDPQYPRERLSFMLEDADVSVLLTQERLAAELPAHGARVVYLDAGPEAAAAREANPENLTDVDGLAYVIYTSGSTGRPKGVCITHRAINRLVFNTNYVSLDASDVVAQASNSSFDAATFEIWGALLHGARLVGVDKEVALSPREFAARLHEDKITTLFLTTALFNQLAAEAEPAFDSLRHLLFGGEAVDPGPVRDVLRRGTPRRLLHVYGPTESTTFATWHLVECVPEWAATVPIGRPLSNTESYILDDALRPVPACVAGSLYVGGCGLARGYLNRPGLTAERFIPHPYSDRPGARLYRTGDVARYLPGGDIEFLGRADHQVKIRGHRIELGEVEAVLTRREGVRDAVVLAREDEPGERRLVAYVAADEPTSAADLRNYLKEKLPAYMVPAAFVIMEALPLSPNGKVDRLALPAPAEARPEPEEGHAAAPRTPVVELLCGIYADALGLEEVRPDDEFFALGGHSLLATKLASRVREAFRIELPLSCLFEEPTVAALAETVERESAASRGVQAPPIEPVPRGGPLPASLAQQRFWFLHQLEPNQAVYNVPAAVRLAGPLDVAALERALSEVVRRHEVLRTTFEEVDGRPVQVIAGAAADAAALPLTDLSRLPAEVREAEAARLIAGEASRGFDLSAGPLLRARLLRLSEREHVVVLVMHHIVADGWSVGVLVEELGALYGAFSRGEESPLPELPIQYADYAVWQHEYLSGAVLEERLAYWRERLGGVPVVELPTDRPRPSVRTYAGATHTFTLPAEVAGQLKRVSRREGVTVFMTLLAAFQVLLSRYTGQEDIVVGTSIANRGRVETERLLGCFFNHLALRTDLSGNPTFGELLKRVREVTLGAYAHQDVPFETLIEALQPERSSSHPPLFQVAFVFQNLPAQTLEVPGLEISAMPSPNPVSKFDLTLIVEERGEHYFGVWEYNTDLFDAATVARMSDRYQTLLGQLVENPEEEVSRAEMSAGEESRQLIYAFGDDLDGF